MPGGWISIIQKKLDLGKDFVLDLVSVCYNYTQWKLNQLRKYLKNNATLILKQLAVTLKVKVTETACCDLEGQGY